VRRASGDEEGVVLLLVLVVIVLTIVSVYAFARTTVLDVVGLRQGGPPRIPSPPRPRRFSTPGRFSERSPSRCPVAASCASRFATREAAST
jgi:hypothetical protein